MRKSLPSAESASLEVLFRAILADDRTAARVLLKKHPALASETASDDHFYESIAHYIYVGDTALHLAAAAYRTEIAEILLIAGASLTAINRRKAQPLHYASDGYLASKNWSPTKQVKTIKLLLASGAPANAQDANGATPLHRAVRTRCAAAVGRLVECSADPKLKNNSGSTSFHLAVQNTGRGGSGTSEAKIAQLEIVQVFLKQGVSPKLQDGGGKTVLECAKEPSIRSLLSGGKS